MTNSFIILQQEQSHHAPLQKSSFVSIIMEKRSTLNAEQNTCSLSSTVKKIHMPNFLTHLKKRRKPKTKSPDLSTKQLLTSHKSFEVTHSCCIPIAEILQYSLSPTNILFDEDYTFKSAKVALVTQPTFQRRINVVSTLCIKVEITLCINVEITLIRR